MREEEVLHYRILKPIGEGGMGIVLKAIDTHLDRPVAIKAIHERLLSDPRAKARLRREALAAASIDHPFICKVYELIEQDGRTLVVMEYVEGETLHELLQQGPLSTRDALRYMGEIAEALGEIHRKGMVHRDVKPSNIMITPQRHAKLMDFGIARATAPPSQEGATLLTAVDGLVGTPRYMSPEQAAYEPADARSDVYSLGVVMFLSLSGVLPFDGQTNRDYLGNALTRAPKDLRALATQVPEGLVRIVEKCLNKDPAQRFESAGALAEALSGVSGELTVGRPSTRNLSRRLTLAAGLAVLILLSLTWSIWSPEGRQPASTGRFVASESVLVTWPSDEKDARISPDGQWVSFVSNRGGNSGGLWLAPLAGGEPRPVTRQEDPAVANHVWSPDGRKLALVAIVGDKRLLKLVPAFGGPPELVYELKEWNRLDPKLVLWAGQSLYLQMNQRLWRFQIEKLALETVNSLILNHVDVRPDEQKILYTPMPEDRGVWMADIDGSNAVSLTPEGVAEYFGRWIDQQRYLFLSSRTGQMDVWEANAFDRNSIPQRIASSNQEIGDVSRDGRIVLLTRVFENADLWCLDPRTGQRRQLTAQTSSDFWATLSADGARLAFQRSKAAATGRGMTAAQILLAQASACGLRDERVVVGSGFGPQLSPDGKWLAYMRFLSGAGALELWLHNIDEQRDRRVTASLSMASFRVFPFERLPANAVWAPTGSELYFVARNPDRSDEILTLRVGPEENPPQLAARLEPDEKVSSLAVAERGKLYSVAGSRQKGWRLSLHDLIDGSATTIYRDHEADEILVPGPPLADGSILFLRAFDSADHSEQRIEAWLLQKGGKRRRVGTIERGFVGTARLDAGSQLLFLTGIEGLAHNIYSFPLAGGNMNKLTENEFQGRTFSGLALSRDGLLMYVQQERNSEIVVIRVADFAE